MFVFSSTIHKAVKKLIYFELQCGSKLELISSIPGIFRGTDFGRNLVTNRLPTPANKPFDATMEEHHPHFFVADAAFPLRNNLMRPYPGSHLTETQQIFNYRLSRARRVIENSFGILVARWRVLRNSLEWSPQNCEKIVLACLVLHNYIMLNDTQRWYCSDSYVDQDDASGIWRDELGSIGGPLQSISNRIRRAPRTAFQMRDTLADYFINGGAIPFQIERALSRPQMSS